MAAYALESAPYPGVNTPYKKGVLLPVVLTSDGSALAIATARSSAGFTITTGANGAFSGTMPKGARATAWSQGKSATAASVQVTDFVTLDPVAGTFSCQHHNDGAETILASGDEIWLFFFVEGG
jgi:hypothetical protein